MKRATILALIAVTFAFALMLTCALEGCASRATRSVEPPAPSSFRPCAVGVEWDAAAGVQDDAGAWRYRELPSVARCP